MPFRLASVPRSAGAFARALVTGQRQVQALMASGAPLDQSLTALLTFLESLSPDLQCSILLLDADGTRLRHGAAPSLPEEYTRAIDGASIGPTAGSCGTAAYRATPVMVSDIATDPLWADYRHLALPHGLRACWSSPILDADSRVLGTFALYRRRRGLPGRRHRLLIDVATPLAAVAIGRWRVEAALRESEARFNAFMGASPAIAWITDDKGRHLYMNPAWEREFGVRAQDYRGRTAFDMVPESKANQIRSTDAEVLASGRPLEIFEDETTIGGRTVYWHCVKFPFRSADGDPLIGGVAINRTRRTLAERALRDLNATLEQKVAERTAALAQALERAEESDRLKSAFLATMSHELRTPLNSIIGFTGIVLQELAGPLTPEQARQLGMVRRSAAHLLALITDVLDLSKIEAGQLVVDPAPFELTALVQRVVSSVQPMAESRGLDLRVSLPGGPMHLTSDERRIEQILLNLLNNGIKFTDAGHVALTVTAQGDAVCLTVEDTGIGIASTDLAGLFQPFRQVDTGLARRHEGTGLGLAICRRLAGLLGGEITVDSEPRRGSVFRVTLPRTCPEVP